nr:PREDICTED: calcium uniporter protein, mitochondrial [Bemisia tabaci]
MKDAVFCIMLTITICECCQHCRSVSTVGGSGSTPSNSPSEPQPAIESVQPSKNEVEVEYRRGLPQLVVPLPSRREKCQFTLKPITNTVGDFIQMLRHEDKGIDRVVVSRLDGVRIASSNTIEALMEEDFKLVVNDREFIVNSPPQEKIPREELERLSNVRCLIFQLYEALNVDEHHIKTEKQLLSRLEDLQTKLDPLEKKRMQLENMTGKQTDIATWLGLSLMGVQFGVLARLTWWEYSWDIMEPVTYFVTYGTAMACYAYYVLTKQEYVMPDVRDRQHLLTLHKHARKAGLDINEYNRLKDEVAEVQRHLNRLRDPLLPLHRLPPLAESPETPFSSFEAHHSKLERVKQQLRSLLSFSKDFSSPLIKSKVKGS